MTLHGVSDVFVTEGYGRGLERGRIDSPTRRGDTEPVTSLLVSRNRNLTLRSVNPKTTPMTVFDRPLRTCLVK